MFTKITKQLIPGAALLALALGLAAATNSPAAVIYVEDFTGGAPAGYNGRSGNFSYVGYSGSDSFEGSFAAQGSPVPQTDAIRITDSNFLLNYATAYNLYNDFWWTFDFIADTVAPSDINIIVGNGSDTFYYIGALTAGAGVNHLSVDLDSSNWIGGPGTYSSFDLSGITYIDIQYSRNGTGEQQYFLDNFALNGDVQEQGGDNGGGGENAVPEPNTLFVTGLAGAVLLALRRRLLPRHAHEAAA